MLGKEIRILNDVKMSKMMDLSLPHPRKEAAWRMDAVGMVGRKRREKMRVAGGKKRERVGRRELA